MLPSDYLALVIESIFAKVRIMLWPQGILCSEKFEETKSPEDIYPLSILIASSDRFLRRLPWGGGCLIRALTIKNFLARRCIHATLRLGAVGSLEDLEVHAWLEINGECFLKGAESFAQFACE